VYNYSQPINGQGGTTEEGIDQFSAAFDAFAQGDFNTALAEADKAVKQMPNNADVQQFRSLVLFAMKRYRESASVAHAALSSGRGWNWETLRSFYPSKDMYTAQLRALEGYTTASPKDAAGLFLLSYHYMMMGHGDAAAKQLRTVVELQPKDTLSARMLKAVDKNAVIPQQPMNEAPMTEQPMADGNDQPMVEQPEVEQPMVEQPMVVEQPKVEKQVAPVLNEVGSWKATKEDGAVFSLTMSADGKFTWSVKAEGNTFDVKGKYELKDGKLKLNSDNGNGALEGVLTVKNEKQFELKLQYQPEGEAGLLFARQ
jgi:tetratricopeptide (TPR) repeat protein